MEGHGTNTLEIDFVEPLRTHRRAIGVAVAVATALMVLRALVSPSIYVASAVVAPISKASSASEGLSRFAGVANLAGMNVGSSSSTQNFDRFMYLLTSPELAKRLITNKTVLNVYFPGWDPDRQIWNTNSLLGRFRSWLFGPPTPPDPYQLADLIDRHVAIRSIPSPDQSRLVSSIYLIRFSDRNQEAANLMLRTIIAQSNDILRQQAASNARRQSAYLENQLETVRTQEYRDTLIRLYSEQQQTLMLTNSKVAYAGELVSGDVMSAKRQPKNTFKLGFITACVAFSLAYFAAIVRFNLRKGRRQEDEETAVMHAAAQR